MKKYLFFVVFIFSVLSGMAQDTVKWDDPWYLFSQKPLHTTMSLVNALCDGTYVENDTNEFAAASYTQYEQKYYINKGRPVYGVAVTACFGNTYLPIAYLYQQDSNGARQLVDSVVRTSNNIKNCNFGYEYFYRFDGGYCNYNDPYPTPRIVTVPCTELYFETPRNVEGDIFVRVNPNNHFFNIPPEDVGMFYYVTDWILHSLITRYYYSTSYNEWISYANSFGYHGMLFPIVELRCRGEVPVARVDEKGNGWATVSWSPDYVEEDYMVGVGRYGTEPADSLTFAVPRGDTSFTITGLENGYPYGVWVKRGCRYAPGGYDTVVWGDWGRYVSLYLPPDTTGILAADESGELKVYPNPAHSVLTVDLSEVNDDVAELTLSDLGGREVLRLKAERPLTKVDVSRLPTGLYLLQASSPGKVYRRRVAVE